MKNLYYVIKLGSKFSHSNVNFTRIERGLHNFGIPPGISSYAMKLAYVLQLGSETDVARRHFVGRIEEVDTGRELRFNSTDELLAFLAECFDESRKRDLEPDEPLSE